MQETKVKKFNKGITLVALVITIIVLLILAGVGISSLTGEDGLIARAKQAAEDYEQAAREEANAINAIFEMVNGEENTEGELPESTTTTVTLEFYYPMVESDNLNPDGFKLKATGVDTEKGIKSYKFYINGNLYSTQETTDETCIINVTGLEEETSYSCYVMVTNGAGEIKQSEILEITTIASTATLEKINNYPLGYYGKEVRYTPQNGATEEWKIFYADEENIYLISSDYVETQYAPNAQDGTAPNGSQAGNVISFGDIVNNNSYTGSTDIQKEDEKVTKWISKLNNFTPTNVSMQKTAYLLDTSIWSEFKDINGSAEYVIGDPTLEMFVASYNNTHPKRTLECEEITSDGYKLKWTEDDSYDGTTIRLDDTESLYILISAGRRGYHLASPWYLTPNITSFLMRRSNWWGR